MYLLVEIVGVEMVIQIGGEDPVKSATASLLSSGVPVSAKWIYAFAGYFKY